MKLVCFSYINNSYPVLYVLNEITRAREEWGGGGGGTAMGYMGYTGMCHCEGYGFQGDYSRIGYINQSIWV